MADLTTQAPGITGNDVTYTAASAGGDTIEPGAAIHVKNGDDASVNVTIPSYINCNQGFDHDLVVAVPAGDDRFIGPFDTRFVNGAGRIGISYSAVTDVTVAALSL